MEICLKKIIKYNKTRNDYRIEVTPLFLFFKKNIKIVLTFRKIYIIMLL